MEKVLLEDIDFTELSRLLQEDGFSFDQPDLIPKAGPGRIEASLAQGRLWYLSHLRPDDWSYNLVAAFRVSETIDPERVEQSFARVLERHGTLNTTISAPDGKPVLCPLQNTEINMQRRKIRVSGSDGVEAAFADALKAEVQRPFDLAGERPVRLIWIGGGNQMTSLLIIVIHHVAADGWSVPILIRDFLTVYEQGGLLPLPSLPIGYHDFAAWQREQSEKNGFAKPLAYWADRLADCPTHVDFPSDLAMGRAPQTSMAARESFTLPRSRVDNLATDLRVAPYAVLITLYAFLVSRYSGTDDLLIAATAAGRERPELEEIVGLFANTVPHRFKLDYTKGFSDNVTQIAPVLLDDLDHQSAPFDQIVANRLGGRAADGDPLCQIAFVLQNYPSASALSQMSGFQPVPLPFAATRYELSLVAEVDELSYKMTLFSRAGSMRDHLARSFVDRFTSLLHRFAEGEGVGLGQTDILTEAEHAALAVRRTEVADVSEVRTSLHEMIRAVAVATPGACAIKASDQTLSYGDLMRRADGIAAQLALRGISRGAVVAILLPRSPDSIAAALATMSIGAAFLLLDSKLPANRLRYMQSDSGASVTLTNAATLAMSDWVPAAPLMLDESDESVPGFEHIIRQYDAEAPAYVIYTSGSTGQPKGAVVPQRGIANFLSGIQALYPITPGDRVLHKAPLTFDVAIWEMLWPLCAGARLVIVPPGHEADVPVLADLITRHAVSVVHFVPTMFATFLDGLAAAQNCDSLRLIFAGGEVLPSALIKDHYSRFGAQLVNSYGPSETSIGVTYWLCDSEFSGPVTPIGDAMPGVNLRILDRFGNDVPDGVPGELFVLGPSVGLGYLGKPDLTRQVFRFAEGSAGETSYATGDLVRRDTGRRLLFLGRLDDQFKLRGQRIEPGEIEAALTRLPGVRQAAALVQKDDPVSGGGHLLAAVELAANATLDETAIRSALALDLPEAMVPGRIALVDRLPVTANGKIDRRSLLDAFQSQKTSHGSPAFSELEARIASIFQELLGVAPTSRVDDFFRMGGHSLLAVQVLTQVHRQLGVRINLAQFIANPTPGALAEHIRANAAVPTGTVQVLRKALTGHPTIILLHPALGITSCYLTLATALSPSWGVILVEDDVNADLKNASLQDRASNYAALLRNVYPCGKVILGGWSLGGLLACAIEQKLSATDHLCSRLLLIDSHLHQDSDQRVQVDRPGFLRALGVDSKRAANLATQTALMDDDAALLLVADALGGGAPNLHELARIYRRNAKAAQGYRPVATSTPALCVIARGYSNAARMRQRWGNILTNCTFMELDENHESIVRAPAVEQIVTALQRHYGEAI